MKLQIKSEHKDAIVEMLAARASGNFGIVGVQEFFQKLITSANLPEEYVRPIKSRFTGDPDFDARRLLEYAIGLTVNPDDTRFTVLGSLLIAFLKQKTPPDEVRTLVAVLVGYKLVLDQPTLQDIATRYQVPLPLSPGAEASVTYGPPITWRGPTSDIELQSFFRAEPAWLDVGFLRRAMGRAASVCRVEIGEKSGTGFLVGRNLVLTNFHVLKETAEEDLRSNATRTSLRFGAFSLAGGENEESGRTFKLVGEKIVSQSPIPELDFALLRVDEKIEKEESIQPVTLELVSPASNSPLNILHHPKGGAMKLSLSGNGVTGVYQDKGIIQYVTTAAGGSSGSPCFDDNWKVVALHHAQQARSFGSIREGILIGPIYERIKQYL